MVSKFQKIIFGCHINSRRGDLTWKRIIIIATFVLAVCLVLFAGYNLFYSYPFIKTYNVEISEDTLNLKYSSEINGAGNLIKIGDKLYYNYEPMENFVDLLTYGLYEISSGGAHRVYWWWINITNTTNHFPITVADNSVAVTYDSYLDIDFSYG